MAIDANEGKKGWRISLFGSLQIIAPTGVAVTISGKKTGELLAYLALNKGRIHTREKLIDIIWGKSDVENARTRLRQEIVKLRSILGSVDSEPSPLEVTKDSCKISEETVVDVIRFEAACLQASRETELDLKRLLYLDAIRLYTIDLLPGYDALWIEAERTRLNHYYSRSLLELAEAQRRLQHYSGTEETLLTLTSHDPLAEEGYVALMRLYADLGQPTRVQQQFQAMERALRDGLGMEPTSGSIELATELREAAGRKASEAATNKLQLVPEATVSAASVPNLNAESTGEPPGHKVLPKYDARDSALRRKLAWRGAVLTVLVGAVITGTLKWRAARHGAGDPQSTKSAPSPTTEKWIYRYKPRAGEKQNSEGRVLVTDGSGIYISGLVQTDKDDTDILTLKLSHEGGLLWVDRYSSPEHDCDRAFSACVDGKGGLYVAGETYVPAHFKDTEGWHLTLLYYDANGKRVWARRSVNTTLNEGNVQVASDAEGGCYLGGTAFQAGKQLAQVLRYNSAGKMLWSKTVSEGTRTIFSRLVVNRDGDVYLGGTARMPRGQSDVNERWLITLITSSGQKKWTHLVDGPGHGINTLVKLETDRGGDLIAAGVLNTNGASPDNPSERRLGLYKFNNSGDIVWRRIVNGSAAHVEVTGLSINFTGDIVIMGQERRSGAIDDALFACFDSTGYQNNIVRFTAPVGFNSVKLSDARIYDDDKVSAFGETSKVAAGEMEQHENSLLYAQFDSRGAIKNSWLFSSGLDALCIVRDHSFDQGGSVCTGQTGSNERRDLFVVKMKPD